MKKYTINIAIMAKVADDKKDELHDRLISAVELAYNGWADVEDKDVIFEEEKPVDERQFLGVWGNWQPDANHSYKDKVQTVGFNSFANVGGYSNEDREWIDQLEVGETFEAEYGNHIVRRIK